MLSVVASMTPYSDYNQSPRNMYQCQMGKQTMGTPAQALQHRTDTKLYRIQTPQTPIARTERWATLLLCAVVLSSQLAVASCLGACYTYTPA
jgi:DNA-directed RNA polymerase beta subunit